MNQRDDPEVNLNQIVERFLGFTRRLSLGGGAGSTIILGVVVIVGLVWLATGFFQVQPGEQAALRMVGKFVDIRGPGLQYFWPSPIGQRDIVAVQEIRRLELGFRAGTPVLDESLMITGDENIVDAQLLVQYDIKDIEQYLYRVVDPDGTVLHGAAETSLRQVVGQRLIDDVLTTEKEAVQADTKLLLQSLLDLYQTGIRVREVKLLNVRPPVQVQDAFDDVVRAREDKERIINLADAYKEDILPRARGEASRRKEAAEAFRQERIAIATGQADRFLSILAEYKKSQEVTRQRLYLEAMEEILPGVSKFIVATDAGGNLLQFLPLTGESQLPSRIGPDIP